MPGFTFTPAPAQLLNAAINFSTAGQNIIITGAAGQIIRVFRIFFVVTTSGSITFENGGPGAGFVALSGAIPFAANGSLVLDYEGEPWFTMSAGNNFVMDTGATTPGQVSGTVYFTRLAT